MPPLCALGPIARVCVFAYSSAIRKRLGFFPIQAGARPRPDHVLPDFGSRYLGGSGCFSPFALLPAGRPRRRFGAMSSTVRPYSVINPWIWAIMAATSVALTSSSFAYNACFCAMSCLYVAMSSSLRSCWVVNSNSNWLGQNNLGLFQFITANA